MPENKVELFLFLSSYVENTLRNKNSQKVVVVTKGDRAESCGSFTDVSNMSPCSHEEADTRLMLHVCDIKKSGLAKIAIRTVDSDVVVLAVSFALELNVEELWIHYGTGKNIRNIAAHEIAQVLGTEKCRALRFFHALSGCDTVSAFALKGKKSFWDTWSRCSEITECFAILSSQPTMMLKVY